MLHFIILDDDARHNINTDRRLRLIFERHGIEAAVSLNTTTPADVIGYCSRNSARDNVYLLDVDIRSNINGIDVAGIIREQDVRAYIVFVSAHPEYVMPSLKTRIFDYLVKPVSFETLERCVKAVYKDFKKASSDTSRLLTVKSGFNVYTLGFGEIVYFEKYGHLLVVHTATGKIESSESLESIESKLDRTRFFRCHKSYIVNISYISRIDYSANTIHLINGESCLLSKRCKKELKELYAG